jgi:hypothetical protein
MPLREQRHHKARAGRILDHELFDRGHRVVTRRGHRVVPGRKADLLQFRCQIVIVVAGDVGVEARQPKSLEQMRLTQIAHVVKDAARFVPARHRPQIARQNQRAKKAADGFQGDHLIRSPVRVATPSTCALKSAMA